MNALLAALLLAQAVDGGTPQVIDVLSGRLSYDAKDGGVEDAFVSGGCWLDTQKCISTAKELVNRREETRVLEAKAWEPPYFWMVVSLVVGVAVGVPLGYGIGHATAK